MKRALRIKIFILSLIVLICVLGTTMFILNSYKNDITEFNKISEAMSKNSNELRNTPGINLAGFAALPNEKSFKIGINIDNTNITSQQLKETIDLYLSNTSSFISEKDWKSLFKPYKIKIEELSSGRLLGEKPQDSSDIIWK